MSQPAALVPVLDPVTGTYLAAGLGIAVVVVASRTLSRRTRVPYPVFLVVAGALASFIPGLGPVTLDPRVVFLVGSSRRSCTTPASSLRPGN